MDRRHAAAVKDVEARGAQAVLDDFEEAARSSSAVIARGLEELARLATNDNEVYETYYQLIRSGERLSLGGKWDRLRQVADVCMFQDFYEDVRFGCLSLDGQGLEHYGECFLQLKEEFIAHRTSVLEENSVLFLRRHKVNPMDEVVTLPKGYRATWEDRARLCVAKVAGKLKAAMQRGHFGELVLKQGKSNADDEFVEVHILGPLTRRSLERVTIRGRRNRAKDVIMKGICEKLNAVGVAVEVRQ